jgi:GNAT superfamily N-acetyltransferase
MERAPLIRQLNPADRDAFFQLRLRALLAHPESFSQSHQEALEKGPEQYDVRQQGAQAAEGDFLLGAFAAADQSLIGMVGRALLTELLARAERVAGLRQIQLVVASKNDAARHLYESAGFRCYGREIEGLCVDGVFNDADLMARFI